MAQSILIFDFGTNEDAAQLARHKVEAWIQGARLGKKILLKFERERADVAASEDHSEKSTEAVAKAEAKSDGKSKAAGKPAAKKKKAGAASKDEPPEPDGKSDAAEVSGRVRLLIRLGFSDHERLTLQRWLGRIATEEPFKSTRSETHRSGEPAFAQTADLFDSLD